MRFSNFKFSIMNFFKKNGCRDEFGGFKYTHSFVYYGFDKTVLFQFYTWSFLNTLMTLVIFFNTINILVVKW